MVGCRRGVLGEGGAGGHGGAERRYAKYLFQQWKNS
jgi:hypothetical protein